MGNEEKRTRSLMQYLQEHYAVQATISAKELVKEGGILDELGGDMIHVDEMNAIERHRFGHHILYIQKLVNLKDLCHDCRVDHFIKSLDSVDSEVLN